jgi:hypothetical protein
VTTAAWAVLAAYAVPVIAGCAACAWSARRDRPARYSLPVRAARYHLTRLRYARRMRGPLPASEQGIGYDRRRWLAALDAWEAPAAPPERTRT